MKATVSEKLIFQLFRKRSAKHSPLLVKVADRSKQRRIKKSSSYSFKRFVVRWEGTKTLISLMGLGPSH